VALVDTNNLCQQPRPKYNNKIVRMCFAVTSWDGILNVFIQVKICAEGNTLAK